MYATHTYESTKFSSKIGFPENNIFKSLIWPITLTDLLTNLIRHERF